MRSLAYSFLVLIPALAAAQITTYYSIPPTSGCNGVWAVSGMTMNCGTAPYTYSVDPPGCANPFSLTSDGDTLFIPLCAMPCTLIITNSDGIECTGYVDLPSGIAPAGATVDLGIVTTGGIIQISSPRSLTVPHLRILDVAGRVMTDRQLSDGDHWTIPAPQEGMGMVLFMIDADGVRYVRRWSFSAR